MIRRIARFLDTLFGRTALVLVFVLILGYVLPFMIFRATHHFRLAPLEREPFYFHAIAAAEAQRAAYDALPPSARAAFLTARANGQTRLLTVTPQDLTEEQTNESSHTHDLLVRHLGPDARFQRDAQHTLWLRFDLGGQPAWLQLFGHPPDRTDANLRALASITGMIAVLTLLAALILLWPLYRPLRRLAAAHRAYGRGTPVTELPTDGPRELALLSESFNHMVHSLESLETEKRTILAGVSHDLRTPLTRLRMRVALLDGLDVSPFDRDIDDIERITEQFLSFVRGEAEALNLESVDPGLLIKDLAERYGPHAQLRLEMAADLATIVADPLSLRRAINNLIDNALSYGAPPIDLSTAQEGSEAIIRVRDHGKGLSAEHCAAAVQAFSRLDPARSDTGHCGLGLAIVDRITKRHGGSINLSNHPDGGLIVEIRLPIKQ
ncbi:MAG: HAMP domain-containing protein [Burkholderiales bacterium]|nr:HAMP domain-containing protein [Burkholderiales bacterium]